MHPAAPRAAGTFGRIARYILTRGVTLVLTILVSAYLIITITNLGGYLDTVMRGMINEDLSARLMSGWLRDETTENRQKIVEQTRREMQAFYGLDQPYLLRSGTWLLHAVTFDWGKSRFEYVTASVYKDGVHVRDESTDDIRTAILARLPRTLLLLGLSYLVLFLVSLGIALSLSHRIGSRLDRLMTALAPLSSIPSWMFGMLLFILLVRLLKVGYFDLGFNLRTSAFSLTALPVLLKGLTLPVAAIFLSKFFQSVYSWRTYFLVYSNENYIELAKAKGLAWGVIERRYLLRPALPSILTSFSLIMIAAWQDCIAVEYFFNVAGIGGLFMQALNNTDTMVIVALVTIFALFLAITVFVLDLVYALVDPRIRIGQDVQNERLWRRAARLNLRRVFTKRTPAFPRLSGHTPELRAQGPQPHTRVASRMRSAFEGLAGLAAGTRDFLRQLLRGPAAIAGAAILLVLTLVSIYTWITIPYEKAIRMWRGDDMSWVRNPIQAPPAWTNWFRSDKLPETIDITSRDARSSKTVTTDDQGNTFVTITFTFEYPYDIAPQDVLVLFSPRFESKNPFVSIFWVTPEGKEIQIKNMAVGNEASVLFSKDKEILTRFNGKSPLPLLFGASSAAPGKAIPGRYQLILKGITFEPGSDVDAEAVIHGQVHGVAGTDRYRRDLSLVLMWGTLVAILFGVLAALGTTLSSVILAATGVWFGGWLDGLIQRISEINMVLPVLPICILISFLYTKSFWVILGVTVGLNIFGNSIKNYRAMFLQLKEAAYIEAARTYGVSSGRMIFKYMIPRLRTVLIPQLIILVPSYIFYETTLSFLGVSDPFLPTLGKLLVTTIQNSSANLPLYLTIEPVAVLILIGTGFALTGFALERYYNTKDGI
jgi:peptide/nickel transport system permease protein